jgi:pimeloyl-ACP methyl ester carboxylesterase
MTHPILDHPIIAQRYFFPRAAPLDQPVWVKTPGGRLACWRSAPPSDRPVLVHFHGNGEVVQDWMGDWSEWVQAQGYEIFLAEYRGYGASEGAPKLAAMLDDVSGIVAAVGVPTSQMVAFGRSIGSLYATEMVKRFPEVKGLVIESGISDLAERLLLRLNPAELGCTRLELEAAVDEHFNQHKKLSDYTGPSLFLHAEKDHLVGIHHAVANHAAAGEKAELLRLPHGDHNSILGANVGPYLQKLGGFLSGLGA